MRTLKQYRTWAVVSAIGMAATGIVMILWPGISALAVCYLLGGACIITGMAELCRYAYHVGISSLLAGIILICHPLGALAALQIIPGIYIIITGVFVIRTASGSHCFETSRRRKMLILGIAGTVSGLLMIAKPFYGTKALMMFAGAALLSVGIENAHALYHVS